VKNAKCSRALKDENFLFYRVFDFAMKNIGAVLLTTAALCVGFFLTSGCGNAQTIGSREAGSPTVRTFSSFDWPRPAEKSIAAHSLKFEQADLDQLLNLYAEISGRSIIRAAKLPETKITFLNQTALSTVEALQALDTVLAAQGVAMVNLGTQYVKAVPEGAASLEPGPVVDLRPDQLPDSSSFVIYIVELKNVTGSEAAPALQPFARLPNSIVIIGGGGSRASTPGVGNTPTVLGKKDRSVVILRDYSSSVRRMLQVLEKLEQQ